MEYIAKTIRGHRFDVDRQGLLGPLDHIISSGTDQTDHGVFRLDPVTGTFSLLVSDIGYPEVMSPASGGSYPVSTVVDDETSRFAHTGLYQEDIIVLRPRLANDPPPPDLNLGYRGFHLYLWGTIPAFLGPALADTADDEFNDTRPLEDRPSFRAINGQYGCHRYGSVPLFDDLAEKSDAELAAYIQEGMAGKTAHPELTGPDLQAMIYFIRLSSLQGKLGKIDPATIANNLKGAGHWDNLIDARFPEIRSVATRTLTDTSVEIAWLTDEPTIGLSQYGPSDYYGLASEIEPGYSKTHAVTLSNLTQDRIYFYKILSKDQAGNLTHYQGSFDVGTPPAILCADPNKDGQVTIADVVLVIQAILGLKPDPGCQADVAAPKGTLTLADAMRILDIVLGKIRQEDLSCCGG